MGGSAHGRVGAGHAQDIRLQGQHTGQGQGLLRPVQGQPVTALAVVGQGLVQLAVQAGVPASRSSTISAGASPQRLRIAS